MKRKITIFENSGYGCLKREIEVDEDKIVSETPDIITIKETFCYGDELDVDYFKTADAFIARERIWLQEQLREITERHNHTIKMAEALREEFDDAEKSPLEKRMDAYIKKHGLDKLL
jgi:hypothetical protein